MGVNQNIRKRQHPETPAPGNISTQKRQPLPANLRAERPQGQLGHLERLNAQRNAHNGDAQHQADNRPTGGE